MKTRIISGAVAIVILAVVMCFVNTPVFAVAASLLSAAAVFEVLKVVNFDKFEMMIPCLIFAFLFPLKVYVSVSVSVAVTILFVILILILGMVRHEKIRFTDTAVVLFVTITLSFAFACLVYLRDGYYGIGLNYLQGEGVFYIVIALISAWGTDTAAYFSGYYLGKRKLCPKISPKKTVEGAIGGVLGCMVLNLVAAMIYNLTLPQGQHYNIFITLPISLLLSIAGMCGDLCASVIKRNFDIKDFGNIMPGHGGVMDRFDSVVFTAPVLFALLLLIK